MMMVYINHETLADETMTLRWKWCIISAVKHFHADVNGN